MTTKPTKPEAITDTECPETIKLSIAKAWAAGKCGEDGYTWAAYLEPDQRKTNKTLKLLIQHGWLAPNADPETKVYPADGVEKKIGTALLLPGANLSWSALTAAQIVEVISNHRSYAFTLRSRYAFEKVTPILNANPLATARASSDVDLYVEQAGDAARRAHAEWCDEVEKLVRDNLKYMITNIVGYSFSRSEEGTLARLIHEDSKVMLGSNGPHLGGFHNEPDAWVRDADAIMLNISNGFAKMQEALALMITIRTYVEAAGGWQACVAKLRFEVVTAKHKQAAKDAREAKKASK